MGLDIENDAGILKHYNVTNVEKSYALLKIPLRTVKLSFFKIK